MNGKVIFAMFGLPGAALAFYKTALPKNKKKTAALMIAIVVLPYVFNFNPFSWYLGVTAGNLFDLMFPPFFS